MLIILYRELSVSITSSKLSCCICECEYNREDKKPLMLKCGHSYCKACLLQVKESRSLCPHCCQDWSDVPVASLPFCYQMVEDVIELRCSEHRDQLVIWCESCSMKVCVSCLKYSHNHCNWQPLLGMVQRLQNEIENSLHAATVTCIDKATEIAELTTETKRAFQTIDKIQDDLNKARKCLSDYYQRLESCDEKLNDYQGCLKDLAVHQEAVDPADDDLYRLLRRRDRIASVAQQLNSSLPESPIATELTNFGIASSGEIHSGNQKYNNNNNNNNLPLLPSSIKKGVVMSSQTTRSLLHNIHPVTIALGTHASCSVF